jgi:hypothetical protein
VVIVINFEDMGLYVVSLLEVPVVVWHSDTDANRALQALRTMRPRSVAGSKKKMREIQQRSSQNGINSSWVSRCMWIQFCM